MVFFRDISSNESTFSLVRTNPLFTGNIKLTVGSSGGAWLNTIDANGALSAQAYKNYVLDTRASYPANIKQFLSRGGANNDQFFDVFTKVDPTRVTSDYADQYDFSLYFAGVRYLNSRYYAEKFSYLSPLYVKGGDVPDYFVVLKINGPVNYDVVELKRKFEAGTYKNTDYMYDLLRNSNIIKTFDLTAKSKIGAYLRKVVSGDDFPQTPIDVSFNEGKMTYWNGIDMRSGVYSSYGEYLHDFYKDDHTLKYFETFISEGFKRHSLLYPNIFNLEFLFDDNTSNVFDHNRYIGFYCNVSTYGSLLADVGSQVTYNSVAGVDNTPRLYSDIDPYSSKIITVNNNTGVSLFFSGLNGDEFGIFKDKLSTSNLVVPVVSDRNGSLHRVISGGEHGDGGVDKSLKISDKSVNVNDFSGTFKDIFVTGIAKVPDSMGVCHVKMDMLSVPSNTDTIVINHVGGSRVNGDGSRYDVITFTTGLSSDLLYGDAGDYNAVVFNYSSSNKFVVPSEYAGTWDGSAPLELIDDYDVVDVSDGSQKVYVNNVLQKFVVGGVNDYVKCFGTGGVVDRNGLLCVMTKPVYFDSATKMDEYIYDINNYAQGVDISGKTKDEILDEYFHVIIANVDNVVSAVEFTPRYLVYKTNSSVNYSYTGYVDGDVFKLIGSIDDNGSVKLVYSRNDVGVDESNYYFVGVGKSVVGDKVCEGLVNCINQIPVRGFFACNDGLSVYIVSYEASDEVEFSVSFTSSTGLDGVMSVNGSAASGDVMDAVGGYTSGHIVLVDKKHYDALVGSIGELLIRVDGGYCLVDKVCAYAGYITRTSREFSTYSNYVAVCSSKKPMLSSGTFTTCLRYKAGVGVLAFYSVCDFDFDYYSKSYMSGLESEYGEYYHVYPGSNMLKKDTAYLVIGDGSVVYDGGDYSSGGYFCVENGTYDYSVKSGDPIVIPWFYITRRDDLLWGDIVKDDNTGFDGIEVKFRDLTVYVRIPYLIIPGNVALLDGVNKYPLVNNEVIKGNTICVPTSNSDVSLYYRGVKYDNISPDQELFTIDGVSIPISRMNIGIGGIDDTHAYVVCGKSGALLYEGKEYAITPTGTMFVGGSENTFEVIDGVDAGVRMFLYEDYANYTIGDVVKSYKFSDDVITYTMFGLSDDVVFKDVNVSAYSMWTYRLQPRFNLHPIHDTNRVLFDFNGMSKLHLSSGEHDLSSDAYMYRDRFTKNAISTEYDYNKENSNVGYAYFNKLVKYACKWRYVDGFDCRGNSYRLNTSYVFGVNNICPSFDLDGQSTQGYTHEWGYLVSNRDRASADYIYGGLDVVISNGKKLLSGIFSIGDFVGKFTVKTGGVDKLQYTKLRYNKNTGECETFFRGVKVIVGDSSKYDGYLFSSVTRVVNKSSTDVLPITFDVIVGDNLSDGGYIVFCTTVYLDDISNVLMYDGVFIDGINMGKGVHDLVYHPGDPPIPQPRYKYLYKLYANNNYNIDGDYRLRDVTSLSYLDLYTLVDKKFSAKDMEYSNIKLPFTFNTSYMYNTMGSGETFVRPYNYGSYNNSTYPNYVYDVSMYIDDFGVNNPLLVRSSISGDSKMYGIHLYDGSTIQEMNNITGAGGSNIFFDNKGKSCRSVDSGGDSTSYVLPIDYAYQLMGGRNYYKNMLSYMSFSNIYNMVNNMSGMVDFGGISLRFERPTQIYKSNKLDAYGVDVNGFNGFSAYELYAAQNRVPYVINRYNGKYEPMFSDVITFTIGKYKGVYLQNSSFNASNAGFGLIRNFNHVKVSDGGIFKLYNKNTSDLFYEDIHEINIGKADYNVLLSSWDYGFHRKYTSSKDSVVVPGTLRVQEDDTFLNNVMVLPSGLSVSDYEVVKVEGVVTSIPDGYDVAYSEVNGKVSGLFDVSHGIIRVLVGMGISKSFDDFIFGGFDGTVDKSEFIGGMSEDEYVEMYIRENILPSFGISAVSTALYRFGSGIVKYVSGGTITDGISINKVSNTVFAFTYDSPSDGAASFAFNVSVKML
jgi:hypothetical protein